MSRFRFVILAAAALTLSTLALAFDAKAEPVQFQSADGLAITGEVTRPEGDPKTAIVLFHQAGSSRGEYATIAPKLAEKGYLVLAIDQRSGNGFGGVANETAKRARKASMATQYTDAIPDLQAAVAYARGPLGAEKVIVWGSSYSAALVLALAGQDAGFADGVLAFSPGEYFRGKPAVKANAAKITVPVFITAAKSEAGQWSAIFKAIPEGTAKTGFVPEGTGLHGSSALIADRSTNEDEYWAAVEAFLAKNLPANSG
jgi:dienelactone hydrolase